MQKIPEKKRHDLITALPKDLFRCYLSLPAHSASRNTFLSQCHLEKRIETLRKLPAFTQSSFLSLNTNVEFFKKYISVVTEDEYLKFMPYLSPNLIEVYKAHQAQKSLDDILDQADEEFEHRPSSSSVRMEENLDPLLMHALEEAGEDPETIAALQK